MTPAELIALASVGLSLAIALLSYRIAKEGRDDARALERDRWAREDRHRFRAEKVVAYAAFLVAMEARLDYLMSQWMQLESGGSRDEKDDGPDPSTSLQTIAILAPAVEAPADKLYNWSVSSGLDIVSRSLEYLGIDPTRDVREMDVEEYHRLRVEVVGAMHQDLGIQ